ncbi:MAG: stage II sporulation protein M [Chloroflexi bacterium]|nr:stage II sporulation protein M [Chloroflexota bacterium]
MQERLHLVWLISKRELRDQLRDWRILAPLLILTMVFPFLMNSFAYGVVQFANQYGGNLIVDRLVPFSILIIGFFPITISLLGALESFVGEKERGTIEPLLSSPLADWQLYLGKLIVGSATPLISSFIAIAIYLVVVSRQQLNMPDAPVFIQLFLLTIAHALLMVSAAIVFSIQSTSVKAANLLASFIIIPVAMLMMGESFLLFWGNNQVLWLAVIAVTIVAGLLVRLGLAHFQREYLLGREIDMLNLRWMGRTFWGYFKGEGHSLFEWYFVSVGGTLRKLAKPLILLVVLAAFSFLGSFWWVDNNLPDYYASKGDPQEYVDLKERVNKEFDFGELGGEINAPTLFLHNAQATLVIAFFGLFSFGVLGIILYILNISLIGVLLALAKIAGISPGALILAGILPHGIFEIPALMLSCAAVMNIGLVLVTPQAGRTVGEVLLEALADWARVVLGLVIPLLAVAAVIESYITPRLLLNVIGQGF